VPAVHVDTLWHRQSAHSSAHQWLRAAVERAAQRSFASGGDAPTTMPA